MSSKKNKYANIYIFVVFLGVLIIPIANFLSAYEIEELLFHLRVHTAESNNDVVWETIRNRLPIPLVVAAFLWVLVHWQKSQLRIAVKLFGAKHVFAFAPGTRWRKYFGVLSVGLFVFSVVYAVGRLNIVGYLQSQTAETEIFETEYAVPEEQNYAFPEEKRNLVFIYLESMETTYMDTASGGSWDYNLLPNLIALAEENVNFGIDGMKEVTGTSWTAAALIASTSGLPLKYPSASIDGNIGVSLPQITTLNDVLAEAGYNQIFMIGSDGDFGGRKGYFNTHGNVEVFDLLTARTTGHIPAEYHNGFWGFEDETLYDIAREKILSLSLESEPFCATLLTVDTHFYDGYVCSQCQEQWGTQYENVISCADRQVADFVAWIQAQEFYNNTTVVIVGDHYSMDNEFFTERGIEKQERSIYCCFINPVAEVKNTTQRTFSMLDLFPTTLAALGVDWDSNYMGMGVNLFSEQKTLIERYGIEVLNSELGKASSYYNKRFLYD